MSLRQLGPDRWQVTVFLGRDSQGRQRRVTKVFHASGERVARRESAKVEASLRESAPEPDAVGHTVAWLAREWHRHRSSLPTSSPMTLSRQRYIIDRIVRDLGGIRLDELTPRDIDAWYVTLRKPKKKGRQISEAGVHHYHRVLGAMIRQGHRWGVVDRSVIERVTPPAPRRRPIRPPTDADVSTVLAAATPDMAVLLRCYLATGARRSEVLGLRWGDLQDARLTFRRTVVQTKHAPISVKEWLKNPHEPPRVVPIDPSTVALLDDWRARLGVALADLGHTLDEHTFIFADLKADPSGRTPRRPDRITQVFHDLCAKVGVSMRLHDLRHWHATQLLAAGVPIPTVSGRLGHAQVATTLNVYSHSTQANDDLAASVIARALG